MLFKYWNMNHYLEVKNYNWVKMAIKEKSF